MDVVKKIIRLIPSGKEIPIKEGQSILSALEAAGYALPNNCRAGACGECKAQVVAGEIDQGFVLDLALSPDERSKGMALMCMARPKSNVVEIEYGDPNALPELFPPQEKLPYIVTDKELVTPRILRLRLRSLGDYMKFWPGQYIYLGWPDGGVESRPYSIANTPNSEGELVLFISKVERGKVSTWIHDKLKLGQQVELSGPYGTFVGDPRAKTAVLCLAAGSGLAPIRSLASAALLRGGFSYPCKVVFSARTRSDLFEVGHFAFLAAKFKNFQFTYTLTREKNSGGLEGRIPDLLPRTYSNLKDTSVYVAGSKEFVASCQSKAKELGAAFIHREIFYPQGDSLRPKRDG